MNDWIITIPKTTMWETYEKEIADVASGHTVMNYRVPRKPSAQAGDRCFVVWNGRVRGWMTVVNIVHHAFGFQCSSTGQYWKPGWYIQRSGEFHRVDGEELKGFRGIRKYQLISEEK